MTDHRDGQGQNDDVQEEIRQLVAQPERPARQAIFRRAESLPQGARGVTLEDVEEGKGDEPGNAQPGSKPVPNLEPLGNGKELPVEVEDGELDQSDAETEEQVSNVQ
jgi:hypothetical protein